MSINKIILTIWLFLFTANLQADWIQQHAGSFQLNDIDFPAGNLITGFACGDNSTYLKTTDGGALWDSMLIIASGNFHAIHFPIDEITGYIACDDGNVLKTTDGGEVWISVNVGTGVSLKGIHFPNNTDTGYVVGEDGNVKGTQDGGETWNDLAIPIPTAYNSVFFINGSEGWVVGNEGFIFHTTNGGSEWEQQEAGADAQLLDIFFPDSINGWIVGAHNTCLKTANRGQNWAVDSIPFPSYIDLHSVTFPAGTDTGFVAGTNGRIAKTTDAGITWQLTMLDSGYDFFAIEFPVDNRTGWVAGSTGGIFKTADGGIGFEETKSIPKTDKTFTALPNPFHTSTSIRATGNFNNNGVIKIFDCSGNLIKILNLNQNGIVNWDRRNRNQENVAPGIYFIELNRDNIIIERLKIVLAN